MHVTQAGKRRSRRDEVAPPRRTDGEFPAVGHTIHKYLGRSATFVYTLLRHQTRFRPIVLARRTANLAEFPFEPIHELLPAAPRYRRGAQRAFARLRGHPTVYDLRLTRALRDNSCQLLHAHFGWSGARGIGPARRLGLPLVTTFYGRDITESWGLPYHDLFTHGTLFTCEGEVMASHLAQVGCPRDRIRIVKIGLDLEQFPFDPKPRTKPTIILQAARFVEKKGVDLSLRAFAAARSRLGPSELWIAGDGEQRSELEALASKLGIGTSVRFFGLVSHAEYGQLVQRAHVCIQPSRTAADGDTEGGAPTVLLEMQAAGIPIVSTQHADIPSVVAEPNRLAKEEDVAALCDELVRIAEMTDVEYEETAARGRLFVEREHDARTIATRVEAVYREALSID